MTLALGMPAVRRDTSGAPSMLGRPDVSGLIGRKTPGGLTIETDEMLIGYYLEEARVAAVHGAAFGVEPAFRVSYATSEEIRTEACNRIATASNALS